MRNILSMISFAFLVVIFSLSCKKKNTTLPSAYMVDYVSKMSGTRLWHGNLYGTYYELQNTGNFNLVNYNNAVIESATIVEINDSTCQFFDTSYGNNTVFFQYYMDTPGKMIVFHDVSPYNSLTYYYEEDSIHFEFHDMGVHTNNNLILSNP